MRAEAGSHWQEPFHGGDSGHEAYELDNREAHAAEEDEGRQVHGQHHEPTFRMQQQKGRELVHRPQPCQEVVRVQDHRLFGEEEEHAQMRDLLSLEAYIRLMDTHFVHRATRFQEPYRERKHGGQKDRGI